MIRETAHPVKALLHLAPPFWGLPRVASLVYTYVDQLQRAEDAIWSWIDGFDVDTAGRPMLELMAKIVGEPSRPASLEGFRVLVKARGLVNRSFGRLGDLYLLADTLFGGSTEIHEASLELVVAVTDPGLPADAMPYAAQVLDQAAAGTVRVTLLTAGTFLLPDLDLAAPDDTWYPDLDLAGPAGTWSDLHGTA